MEEIIIDAIRLRISEHNVRIMKYCELITAVMCDDMNDIIVPYLGYTRESINPEVAAKCITNRSATFAGHTLAINALDKYDMNDITFTYSRTCKPFDPINPWIKLQDTFYWSDYIEFILTGYNEYMFNQMQLTQVWADHGEFEKYTPCCAHGNAQQLTVRLLTDLRSQILNSVQ